MKVCIVAEGCYPYVVGGVSSWINSMIKSFPEIEFVVLSIVANRSYRGKFVYELPENVTQVATIAWGKALGEWAFFTANLFALAAMMTSYWAVAGSFLTNIVDKFNFKSEDDVKTRLFVLACVVIPPFILAYSGLVSFVDAIYLAGTFGGVIMSVLPVLMLRSARKTGDMEPSWQCGWIASAWVQWSMIVLFCGAALYAVLGLFGLLPAAW